MKSTISILTLQEVLKKTKCNTLVNSAVLEFTNGTVQTKGHGIEKDKKVDGTLSFQIQYPTIVQENGEVPIADLQKLLSLSEIYEKEDQVSLSVTDNKLVIDREIPKTILTCDIADKKFLETSYKGKENVEFIPKIKLTNAKGNFMEIPLNCEVILDSSMLKSFASAASKINPDKVPFQVKDGKFFSALKGTDSSLMSEIRVDKAEGNGISKYPPAILEIFTAGFGLATLRFADSYPIHIHFELNDQKADYLLSQTG